MINYLLNGTLILLLGLLWASESVLGKLLLTDGAGIFDFPIVLNFGTVIAILILAFLKRNVRVLTDVNIKSCIWLLSTALTLVFFPYCILYFSLQQMSPAETSLITSLTPVFSMILGLMLRQMRLSALSIVALVSGVFGASLLIVPQLDSSSGNASSFYYVIMLLVPLSYAASGYFLKASFRAGITYNQLLLATNLVSGCLFLILNNGFPSNIQISSASIYLTGVVFNIAAIALMLFISGRSTPFSLSFSNHATLVFSFIFSALFFNQEMNFAIFLSVILIVFSSVLTQVKK